MTSSILTQTTNVTTLILVTLLIPVTQETLLQKALSPLSPLSLLLVSTIHARDKGLGTTDVTSDSGDTGDSTIAEGVDRLPRLPVFAEQSTLQGPSSIEGWTLGQGVRGAKVDSFFAKDRHHSLVRNRVAPIQKLGF
jgi:hypothetical protein